LLQTDLTEIKIRHIDDYEKCVMSIVYANVKLLNLNDYMIRVTIAKVEI